MTFKRTSCLIIAVACFGVSLCLGQESTRIAPALGIIPTESLKGYDHYLLQQDLEGSALTRQQVELRIARIYEYQSDVLTALAYGDNVKAGAILDRAMLSLERLASRRRLHQDVRFQELYRSVVIEYERHFGSIDLAMEEVRKLRPLFFLDAVAISEPEVEDRPPMRAVGAPLQTRVPMPLNSRVRSTITWFLQNRRSNLERWMTRADTYFPMMSKIFAEEGLPDELKYLSAVESALQPAVVSSAKAVGLWQFMSATGKAYDLKIDSWVDERMDPEKATRAAAKHLKDLYRMYGNDWHVAMAGYNCSPRCIQRAIRRAGGSMKNIPSYWDFLRYLPRETQGYLPQYIAVAHIMSNPEQYGLANAPIGQPLAFEMVTIRGGMDLAELARLAGTDEETLQALNSELKRGSTPPGRAEYQLRLPPNHAEQFKASLAGLPQEFVSAAKSIRYRVRRGDSLGRIAEAHGVTVQDLRSHNEFRGSVIHPGQILEIPPMSGSNFVALVDPTVRTVNYGTREISPLIHDPIVVQPTNRQTVPAVPARLSASQSVTSSKSDQRSTQAITEESTTVHIVRRGETLGNLARQYGTSVRNLQNWNNLRGTRIRVGQRLNVRGNSSRVVHTVRRGETLGKLADQYGTSVRSIQNWNNLRGTRIRVGQHLTIRANTQAEKIHVVRRGESLSRIAQRYGASVNSIRDVNGLRSSVIHPGQRLMIPQ